MIYGNHNLVKTYLTANCLFLDKGYLFGPEGEGFERTNLACPRNVLEKALKRFSGVTGAHGPECERGGEE